MLRPTGARLGRLVPREEELRGSSHEAAQRRFGDNGQVPGSARLTQPVPTVGRDHQAASLAKGTGPQERAARSMPATGPQLPGVGVPGSAAGGQPTSVQAKAVQDAGAPSGPNGAQPATGRPDPASAPATRDAVTGSPSGPPQQSLAPQLDTLEELAEEELQEGGRHRRPLERQASYREVFAIREFRALFTAQVLSYVGDQFAQVAIALLVYDRTGSAFLTALAYALTYLPPIIGGPLLSGLADRLPRRLIMIVCDLLRAALVAGMAVPRVPFAALCGLLFCTMLLGSPFNSARSALMPDVLPGDTYVVGSSIANISYQASQILGFVAGAAVVAVLDPSRTLGLDAATFVLSAGIVSIWVKGRPAPEREEDDRPSLWRAMFSGARLVFRSPMLRSLLLFGWLAGFYILPEGLAAPYVHSLGGHTIDVGLLMAAMPIGTVVGAFVFGRLVPPSGRVRVMGWMAMLTCAPLVACAAHPPLWVVLALFALSGVGGAFQLVAASAFVVSVPNTRRAGIMGLAQSGLLAAQGIGILIGGAAAQAIGPAMVVALSGLVGLTCATILALGWTHRRTQVIADMRSRAES
jgi:MFS family permease